MSSSMSEEILSQWIDNLRISDEFAGSKVEKNNTAAKSSKIVQWGKPVITFHLKNFATEEDFRGRVNEEKNYPNCAHPHKACSNGLFKCCHVAIGGVACTHMTKVVYNQQKTTAEIYATGKHNNSSLFEFATVPQEESSSALVQFLILNDSEQLTIVQELLNTLQTPSGPTSVSKVYALVDLLSAIAKEKGILSVVSKEIISLVKKVVDGTNNSLSKEGAMLLLLSLLKKFQKEVEPLLSSLLLKIFQLHGDRSALVRDSAALLTSELMQMVNPHSFRLQYNSICLAIVEEDWKVRVAGLNALKELANREDVRRHVTLLLPDLIPKVSECMLDSKRQVMQAGIDAMNVACCAITNEDIRHLTPNLVSVIARPDESPQTLNMLLETTFVSNVDSATLALIAPLLGKILRGRVSILKRKAAKVIENMCRLVQNPSDVAPFVPLLLPAMDKNIDEIVDQEVCDVLKTAREVLLQAMGEGAATENSQASTSPLTTAEVETGIVSILQSKFPGFADDHEQNIMKYIAQLCSNLIVYDSPMNPTLLEKDQSEVSGEKWKYGVAMSNHTEWRGCISSYVEPFLVVMSNIAEAKQNAADETADSTQDEEPKPISTEIFSHDLRVAALGTVPDMVTDDSVDEKDLVCNIEFSLAFGGKILLHNTKLKLGRGRRYALMGKNGAGKTTLLTNIGNNNIEGIPADLKTIYVQHDDISDDHNINIVDEVFNSKEVQRSGASKERIRNALQEIGFTELMMSSPRSTLSGGWKMKLMIMKAMMSDVDVLLLDEPTNHLDTASVQWLTDYLISLDKVTCLIVSHDTLFLDKVVSDVIHYETKKLVYYKGNISSFVKIHPEAKYYFELQFSPLAFVFPTPERLDGINSTTKTVLKMDHVSYTYPVREGASSGTVNKPQIIDASVKVCLASRIAVVGANGSGKSTLIKLLVQETKPDEGSGEVWKHQNLRVAYVAQHSFYHIEKHLDISPVDYIKQRFAGGVDKEAMEKANSKLTEDEEQHLKGENLKYGDVTAILGRRKNGRTIEYECTFHGQNPRDKNKYIASEKLIEMGYEKLVNQCDLKTAAMAAGLDVRPLLNAEIQKHLDDFNLEAEYGTHGTIKRLSGGQKVKLVLAAAMWNKPHLLVLDEPTNYLDREALGALKDSIRNYAGGVIIISHNDEFTASLCTEKWLVENNRVTVTGSVVEGKELKTVSIKKNRSSGILEEKNRSNGDLQAATEIVPSLAPTSTGNTNKNIVYEELLNPKTLERLSKKEYRKLEKCAIVAGVTVKEYVSKIRSGSPEWAWL